MTAVAFQCVKLKVGDISVLEAFYTQALGFAVIHRIAIDDGDDPIRELFFALPGETKPDFALIKYLNRPTSPVGETFLTMSVADLETAISAIEARGGRNLTGVIEAPQWQVRLAFVSDPEGHELELVQQMA